MKIISVLLFPFYKMALKAHAKKLHHSFYLAER
jgi:hypothetical protein